jgi:hypothetical protein
MSSKMNRDKELETFADSASQTYQRTMEMYRSTYRAHKEGCIAGANWQQSRENERDVFQCPSCGEQFGKDQLKSYKDYHQKNELLNEAIKVMNFYADAQTWRNIPANYCMPGAARVFLSRIDQAAGKVE